MADTPLRRRLQAAVAARAAEAPPPGRFTEWNRHSSIFFWTIGRRTGLARMKEFGPFAAVGDTLYLAEEIGARAHWVKNALESGSADVASTASGERLAVRVRVVEEPEASAARSALHRRISYGSYEQAFINDAMILAFEA